MSERVNRKTDDSMEDISKKNSGSGGECTSSVSTNTTTKGYTPKKNDNVRGKGIEW